MAKSPTDNILNLMDGLNVYKDGWHPMDIWRARDGGNLYLNCRRPEVEIRYYFIDSGTTWICPNSTYIEPL